MLLILLIQTTIAQLYVLYTLSAIQYTCSLSARLHLVARIWLHHMGSRATSTFCCCATAGPVKKASFIGSDRWQA